MNHMQKVNISAQEAWISVVAAFQACSELLEQRLGKVGVKTIEHEILVNLLRDAGISQQALVQRCFTAKSHVSGVLKTMEKEGLVRRESDPQDARAKRLFLTDKGLGLAAQCARVQMGIVKLMASECTDTELNKVHAVMKRMRVALLNENAR
jgi:DNA-binding MarR family transcriptional regulator